MFTYAHIKWFYGQSENTYYLNYFINVDSTKWAWLLESRHLQSHVFRNKHGSKTPHYEQWYTMPCYTIINQLMYRILLKITIYFDFERETWINNYLKVILSFIWVVWLLVTIQYRWKTIQTGLWDLVKGDCDCLMKVTP